MFQIIVKEKGVFTNVTSPSTKAKLRILFEVAPLALLVRRIAGNHLLYSASVEAAPTTHQEYALHVAILALLLLFSLPPGAACRSSAALACATLLCPAIAAKIMNRVWANKDGESDGCGVSAG